MSLNTAQVVRAQAVRAQAVGDHARPGRRPGRAIGGDFSTALFTGLNVAVFLALTACVAGAAILYALGA